MLSKKDKEEIRAIIQEELKAALVRTVTIERGPRQQGDPEKVVRDEQWNVLDFFAAYAPKIEAALRGMQEDVDKASNKVDLVGGILTELSGALISIDKVSKRLEGNTVTLIE